MTTRHRRVRVAANFRRNLERIEAFLQEASAPLEFDAILRRLAEEIVPSLERFPEIGADSWSAITSCFTSSGPMVWFSCPFATTASCLSTLQDTGPEAPP